MCKTNRTVLNCDTPAMSQDLHQASTLNAAVKAEAGKKGTKTMRKQLLAGALAAVGLITLAGTANANLFIMSRTLTHGADGLSGPSVEAMGTSTATNAVGTTFLGGIAGAGFSLSALVTSGRGNPDATFPGTSLLSQITGNLTDDTPALQSLGFEDGEIIGFEGPGEFENPIFEQVEIFGAKSLQVVIWEDGFVGPEGLLNVANSFTSTSGQEGYVIFWSSWVSAVGTPGPAEMLGQPATNNIVPNGQLANPITRGYLANDGIANVATFTDDKNIEFTNTVANPIEDADDVIGYEIRHIFEFIHCADPYAAVVLGGSLAVTTANGFQVNSNTCSPDNAGNGPIITPASVTTSQDTKVSVIPEPATLGILGLGLIGLGAARRRRDRKAA